MCSFVDRCQFRTKLSQNVMMELGNPQNLLTKLIQWALCSQLKALNLKLMIQYGGAIELDSEDQHKPAEIQLHTDDFADQQQSSTPPQEILDSSSSSNAPAPTVDTVIPDQSSHYNKKMRTHPAILGEMHYGILGDRRLWQSWATNYSFLVSLN